MCCSSLFCLHLLLFIILTEELLRYALNQIIKSFFLYIIFLPIKIPQGPIPLESKLARVRAFSKPSITSSAFLREQNSGRRDSTISKKSSNILNLLSVLCVASCDTNRWYHVYPVPKKSPKNKKP